MSTLVLGVIRINRVGRGGSRVIRVEVVSVSSTHGGVPSWSAVSFRTWYSLAAHARRRRGLIYE